MKIEYSLFDTLLEPVFIVGKDRNVIYCNNAAANLTGYSIRKICRGMSFTDLFKFNEPIESLANLPAIQEPTPYKEVSFKTEQGHEGKIQITLQLIATEGQDKNWIIFFRDVTLEERLQKKYRSELEKKETVIKDLEEAQVQLENYSRNLEKMVDARTLELSNLNKTMSALLDSLGQGFFLFDSHGKVLDFSSKACETTIECRPDGKLIWDVLKVSPDEVDGFISWLETLFSEMLPFEDLIPLAPLTFPHSDGHSIKLEYYPLRTNQGVIESIVVVASDITSLIEAQQEAEIEKAHAKLIINMIKSKRAIQSFIQDGQRQLTSIENEFSKQKESADYENIYRSLHTLKGGSAQLSIKAMTDSCHQAEELLARVQTLGADENIDPLKQQCADIKSQFLAFKQNVSEILGNTALSTERQIEVTINKLSALAARIASLPGGEVAAHDLFTTLAMEPASHFIEPYNEVILRLAERLSKKVAPLQIKADSVSILPEVYNPLFTTLVHAFRNAIDHGIELPESRTKNGKTAEGHIAVNIDLVNRNKQTWLSICIQDDGGGINPNKIREKLQQKSIEISGKTDQEIIQYVFESQFSTKEEATDISGRGIGMDAIRFAAEDLGGKVWVESKLGVGTTLFVQVPYIRTLYRAQSVAA